MSTKTTAKKGTGTDSAKSNKSQKVIAKKANKASDVTNNKIVESSESQANDNLTEQVTVPEDTALTSKPKVKKEKKAADGKVATPASKKVTAGKTLSIGSKKIRLAATCYHYYRNWLKDWMRSHGASSARFQKSSESYDGHLIIFESEKAKGLKALERWRKENPETKEIFWDVKK